jgi:hypothetical protein
MKRRSWLGRAAALVAAPFLPKPNPAPPTVTAADVPAPIVEEFTYNNITEELSRAYPPGYFAAQVEKESVFSQYIRAAALEEDRLMLGTKAKLVNITDPEEEA